jgi:D-alanyl-lipoteichoic acid acyltransferase DltB (MBOAT superfamily)
MDPIFRYALLLIPACLAYWAVVPRRWRPAWLLLLSLGFVASFGLSDGAYVAGNVVFVWLLSRGLTKDAPARSRRRLLQWLLAWLVGNIVFFKYATLALSALFRAGPDGATPADWVPRILIPLGLSYVIFRLVHYVVERYRGKVPESTFSEFAAYVLFFPTFVAGPVERFPAFHRQTAARKDFELSDLNVGVARILRGAFRKIVVADNLALWMWPALESPDEFAPGRLVLSVYALAIFAYMDFGGYTDIAVGVSRLFGYRMIENFNHPYFKPNIAEYWRNWHMSLYGFIRDYFFLPFFARSKSQLVMSLGVVLTMVVFMLWHEGNLPFLMLGVYHGVAIATWNQFQVFKRARPRLRAFMDSWPITALSVAVTFHFVAFGILFFTFELDELLSVVRRLFGVG